MSNITAGIYGGGPLYSDGEPLIDALRASGFTTVVAWGLHVQPNGDLHYNDSPLISEGRYVGDNRDWPAQLAALKQAPTSVNRLVFSIGGWSQCQDFPNIKALLQSEPAVLAQNFKTLKATIPHIDAIDFDDETLYDTDTTVGFATLLGELGWDVTFCPYDTEQLNFWVGCLATLERSNPGLVTAFNLQCYDGGAGNTPSQWIDPIARAMGPGFDAATFVVPGRWCRHDPDGGQNCVAGECPEEIEQTLAGWKSSGIQGAWIWLLDDVLNCAASGACSGDMGPKGYASAIVEALG